MRSYRPLAAAALVASLCSCHKNSEHSAELTLKSVNCHTSDKSGVCAEKYGGGSFEIAEIPEEYREQFLSECGANLPCDVVLSTAQGGGSRQNICKITRFAWGLTG